MDIVIDNLVSTNLQVRSLAFTRNSGIFCH